MNWLLIPQIIVSLLLIAIILFQTPSSSLGSAFGSGSTQFHTKKGVEKVVFIGTIILAFLFVAISLINIIA